MTHNVDVDELLGLAEVAELYGVTTNVIGNWRVRSTRFPAPVHRVRATPLWLRSDLLAWRRPG